MIKRFWICCFGQNEIPASPPEIKLESMDSELTTIEKLNIVKDLIRKSVEHSKQNRVIKRKKEENIIGFDQIPVYENVQGQLKTKNEFKNIFFTA